MTLFAIGNLVGGVGLFLLGMGLITSGLRLAAGHALPQLLSRWTGSWLRGLFAGALITCIVQSSSAVTVAIIGFVNAGIINLGQAVTVVFGANLGTTMTGWLVAATGVDVDITRLALPFVGAGMVLRLAGAGRRHGALGEAVAGFGVFFIGIDILKDTFAGLGQAAPLEILAGYGAFAPLLLAAIGFAMTALMQSSSAAMVVALTAAGGGLIPLADAAAVVIGTNIGTTATAALAVIGATPNARRVAAAHVTFNLVTGVAALIALPLLLVLVDHLRVLMHLPDTPTTVLALFHTTFNLAGLALMVPASGRLVGWLQTRFRSAEEDEARVRYLDSNIVSTPILAMHALTMELGRVGEIARRMAKSAISAEGPIGPRLGGDRAVLEKLVVAIGEYSNLLQRSDLPPELDDRLPNALRVSRYYAELAELATEVAAAQREYLPLEDAEIAAAVARFQSSAVKFLDAADAGAEGFSVDQCSRQLAALEDEYHQLKNRLLRAGTTATVRVRTLVALLDIMSNVRRMAQQAEKAARYLAGLHVREANGATAEAEPA